jgi:hypothetical protein
MFEGERAAYYPVDEGTLMIWLAVEASGMAKAMILNGRLRTDRATRLDISLEDDNGEFVSVARVDVVAGRGVVVTYPDGPSFDLSPDVLFDPASN